MTAAISWVAKLAPMQRRGTAAERDPGVGGRLAVEEALGAEGLRRPASCLGALHERNRRHHARAVGQLSAAQLGPAR